MEDNYRNPNYTEFIKSSLVFYTMVVNEADRDEGVHNILEHFGILRIYNFLSDLTDFTLETDERFLFKITNFYSRVFETEEDVILADIYDKYTSTFHKIFNRIHPDGTRMFNKKAVHLMSNVAFCNKRIANELIEQKLFIILIELLRCDPREFSFVVPALYKVFDFADQTHVIELFNYNPQFVDDLLTITRNKISHRESHDILKMIIFMLDVNTDNQEFVRAVTSRDDFISLTTNHDNQSKKINAEIDN